MNAIRICQTEDATHRQVQALHPESRDCGDSTPINKLTQYSQQWGRPSYRGRGPFRGGRPSDPAAVVAQPQGPGPRETTSTVLRLHVNNVGQTLTGLKKNVELSIKSAIIVGGLDTSQMYAEKTQTITTGLRSIT